MSVEIIGLSGVYSLWHVTVSRLQQELVVAHEMRDEKLSEIQRQTQDTVTAQQAAFDKKVSDR